MSSASDSASAAANDTVERELDERRLQVVAEQALGLRWQIVATAIVVSAIAWGQAPTPAVVVWLIAVVASREWRAAMLQRITTDRSTPIAERLRATVRSNALIGACNGAAALFMIWLDPVRDAVLTMILVSWGAGAVSTSATVIRAFVVYAALLFVPTAAMWLLSGSALGLAVGALVLMFFGVQWRFARRNLDTFDESFRIRLENDALARSLQQERSQLAAARDSAVQANQEKSRFLAAASHDLRQPLQAMSLNVGALEHMAIAGEAGIVVGEVAASLGQLRSMLDALLDLSKLDAGMVMPQLRGVQLDRLLSAVSSSLRVVAEGRGLSLQCTCPSGLAVRTDPELLRSMLANLLDNAIKFTAQGGVELRATATETQVEISVHDSGPGIAPEHHRLIFEDLVQLQRSAIAGARGHGLGLGIVRRLAKLLQVQVMLESELGHGATFRLAMPRALSAEADAEPSTSAWSIAGCSVLVLDDDPMVRGAYTHALTAMGCQSAAAATIDEALRQLEVNPAQAAVVDYQLAAGGDGFEAITRLRGRLAQLPVVMVTASVDSSIGETARRHGVLLLHKPVDARSLGQALAQVLGREAALG